MLYGEELERSLRNFFSNRFVRGIMVDGPGLTDKFERDRINYGLRKGWLTSYDEEEIRMAGRPTIHTFRLTILGESQLRY